MWNKSTRSDIQEMFGVLGGDAFEEMVAAAAPILASRNERTRDSMRELRARRKLSQTAAEREAAAIARSLAACRAAEARDRADPETRRARRLEAQRRYNKKRPPATEELMEIRRQNKRAWALRVAQRPGNAERVHSA